MPAAFGRLCGRGARRAYRARGRTGGTVTGEAMAPMTIRIEHGLRPAHLACAVAGFWDAFARKLRYPLGPRRKALVFLERVMDPGHAISAVSERGGFLGVAGFKTPEGAFVGGGLRDMAEVYGWFGALARGPLASLLERGCEDGTLLMDGVFVRREARGLGVGTALLDAVERHAAARGLARVRLDVIDTNPRARALYERRGFRARGRESTGPFRHVFGFESATVMVKTVGTDNPAPPG